MTKILAIETSCDETACALVENGRRVLKNCLYSQVSIHREYGGVVPEIASRNHILKLPEMVDACGLDKADCIAVTAWPGLLGALICGVSYAKSLAYALKKPLVAVHHIEGHISANYITYPELEPPFLCLVVSGGHTVLCEVLDFGKYRVLGQTRDDAAGEAIDKVARSLGLPYPGGPNLQALASGGDAYAYPMPKAFKGVDTLDFSFSGPKTAVVNMLHHMEQKGEKIDRADLAASFEQSVVDALCANTLRAARELGYDRIALAGGVAANSRLRGQMARQAAGQGAQLYLPDLQYCTDNAAMIGAAAYYKFRRGEFAGLTLNASARKALF